MTPTEGQTTKNEQTRLSDMIADLSCVECELSGYNPACEECAGTGKRQRLVNREGATSAMMSAVNAMFYVYRTDRIIGSFDETAECLESAVTQVETLLMCAVMAARMMKANGLGEGIADYIALREAIQNIDPNYCAKIGVTL